MMKYDKYLTMFCLFCLVFHDETWWNDKQNILHHGRCQKTHVWLGWIYQKPCLIMVSPWNPTRIPTLNWDIYTLAKHGLLTNKRNGRKHDSTMVYLETCILLNQDHTLTNITKVGFKTGIYDSQTHALGLFWSVSTWHHPFCRFNDSEHTPWWRASRDGKDPPWSFRKDQWIG